MVGIGVVGFTVVFVVVSGVEALGVLTGDVCVIWSDFGGAGGRLPLLEVFLRNLASRTIVCLPGCDV